MFPLGLTGSPQDIDRVVSLEGSCCKFETLVDSVNIIIV